MSFLGPIADSKPRPFKRNQLHLLWFKPRCRVEFGVWWLSLGTNICDLSLHSPSSCGQAAPHLTQHTLTHPIPCTWFPRPAPIPLSSPLTSHHLSSSIKSAGLQIVHTHKDSQKNMVQTKFQIQGSICNP